jgi:hypothetical protein
MTIHSRLLPYYLWFSRDVPPFIYNNSHYYHRLNYHMYIRAHFHVYISQLLMKPFSPTKCHEFPLFYYCCVRKLPIVVIIVAL